jgi:hypothetical protein
MAALVCAHDARAADAPAQHAALPASATLFPILVTPPFGFDAFHVQGLVVTDDHFFLTSVDKSTTTAIIFKINRADNTLAGQKVISKLFDFHPGGMDYDGTYIWVPVAVYDDNSHTYMTIVDPATLRHKVVFEVQDHIGAAARIGDMVIGANWNARDFYFFTLKGELIDKKPSPTGIGYQDCKGVNGFLMCTGGGFLDWIDVDKWELAKRYTLGESLAGSPLSREGVAWNQGNVFFLPDDGEQGRIYGFSFTPQQQQPE